MDPEQKRNPVPSVFSGCVWQQNPPWTVMCNYGDVGERKT